MLKSFANLRKTARLTNTPDGFKFGTDENMSQLSSLWQPKVQV